MSKLAIATANGQLEVVQKLLEANANPDKLGPDGTSPLCAAALWGNDELVSLLVEGNADVNIQNDGTKWTPLHAAAFQEHGKVCHILMMNGAKINIADHSGCTPVDYASIAEPIWPFFAAKGAVRTSKADLVRKGVIRKRTGDSPRPDEDDGSSGGIKGLSRPGSAYVRVQRNPFANPGGSGGGSNHRATASRAGSGKPPMHPGK